MVVKSQAPTRISFFGGGTDLDTFARKNGGIVINMAINLRQHIEINENVIGFVIPERASFEFYEKILLCMDFPFPPGFFSTFDAIIESGLGSSASATVALIAAVLKLTGKKWTREKIARKAWDIEVNDIGLFGGRQDQYASSFGGLNVFTFNYGVNRTPLKTDIAHGLAEHTLLFYSGQNRKDSKIQEAFMRPSSNQIAALNEIKVNAYNAYEFLQKRDYEKVGELLALSWAHKVSSNPKVTNEKIDKIHHIAMRAGAWGGKVCGSGGGGYMIYMARPAKHGKIIEGLGKIGVRNVDYSPDFNGVEARIL